MYRANGKTAMYGDTLRPTVGMFNNQFILSRFVRFISVNSYHDIDWNSFVADRSVTNYFGQVPQSGRFTHFDSTMWLPGRDVKKNMREWTSTYTCTIMREHFSCRITWYTTTARRWPLVDRAPSASTRTSTSPT